MTTKKKPPLDGFTIQYEDMPLKKPTRLKKNRSFTGVIKTYLKYITEVISA